MLATLLPTVLMTSVGIVLLAVGSGSVAIVAGVLVLAFCTSSVTGYILGSIFVSRGSSLARVQNDFLSTVSHELRTPLTSIRMFMETLSDERLTDPEEKRQCFDLLKQEATRLEGLVERLLKLSQIEAGRHAFESKPIAVDDVISDALSIFDVATLAENVPVDVQVERDLYIVGDRAALSEAVANLLVNAHKYTDPDTRRIALAARSEGKKRIEIVVTDNGPGIPKSEQRHIFDKFERGRAAINGHKRGSGLGLAIVKEVARAHHGSVEVHSRPGRGSELSISLKRMRS